ncbi:transient receptor potential cation channel subfamily V member 4-like [Haliotis rufescens]|uniref:transient receptor potential cation channel subfamily V member 4-like n=1 Tax=Haliotis rufescens TaxID=6454 RepID=UPI00201EE03E|nr:transient receptor potential cation channel subfamily V member 4-like [Haliotis rufescens]
MEKITHELEDPMLNLVSNLMDKTLNENELIKFLEKNKGKRKGEKAINKERLVSYRFTDAEKNKRDTLLESDSGESLLHIAVSCRKNEVAKYLIACDPGLINCERKDDEYRGQTPFHIAIAMAMDNQHPQSLPECMIHALIKEDEKETNDKKNHSLLKKAMGSKVRGKKLRGTVMLGGTPLSIAALNNDVMMVNHLLDNNAELHDSDSVGNTVFHSLVLYASFNPDKERDIINMFDILAKGDKKRRQNVQLENKQNQTALHLAAVLGLDNVFEHILGMEDVYKFFTSHDGVFDIYECDVTEIDKGTWDKAVLQMSPDFLNTGHRAEGLANGKVECPVVTYWKQFRRSTNQSILEIICSLKTEKACNFLKVYTVREVVYLKWEKYWHCYYVGLLLHLLLMSTLTYHSERKTFVIRNAGANHMETWNFKAWNGVSLVISLLYIILEFLRSFVSWQPFHFTILHHNGVYRCIFVLFGFALLIDTAWNAETVTSNYWLVIALIFGWWSTTFFLRGIRQFSYITVMLQKVLFADMLKFVPIIFIMILAFTSAMHYSMSMAEGPPGNSTRENSTCCDENSDFGNFTISLMTMFKMMTGHEEIKGLEQAWRHGSIPLFVLSVIVIQMFLLNILIAIMSKTCDNCENTDELLWLQRLSIVLFIEDMLPKCLRTPVGKEEKTDYGSTRYLLKIDRVRVGDAFSEDTFEHTVTSKAVRSLHNLLNKTKVGEEMTTDSDRAKPVQYLVIEDYGRRK